jgi:DNA-binding transcriptional MerR regulator
MYMKISEFAAFSGISVRTLRLYDRMGLFRPEHVDPDSGYRYYLPEQLQDIDTVLGLRRLGFSLEDIQSLRKSGFDRDLMRAMLRDRRRECERIRTVQAYNIQSINAMLKVLDGGKKIKTDPQERAERLSKLACLENERMESELSRILWL